MFPADAHNFGENPPPNITTTKLKFNKALQEGRLRCCTSVTHCTPGRTSQNHLQSVRFFSVTLDSSSKL